MPHSATTRASSLTMYEVEKERNAFFCRFRWGRKKKQLGVDCMNMLTCFFCEPRKSFSLLFFLFFVALWCRANVFLHAATKCAEKRRSFKVKSVSFFSSNKKSDSIFRRSSENDDQQTLFFLSKKLSEKQLAPLVTSLLELDQGHIFKDWPALGELESW